jgi:hypothetical protein
MLGDLTLGYNDDTGEPGTKMGTFNNAIGEDIFTPYDEESNIRNIPGIEKLASLPGSRWIGNQFTPAFASNISDAFEAGPLEGLGSLITGPLGAGGSTYEPYQYNPYRAEYKKIKIPIRGDRQKSEGMPGGIR